MRKSLNAHAIEKYFILLVCTPNERELIGGTPYRIYIVGAKCVSKSLAASRRPVHDGRILYCVITWQFYETVEYSYKHMYTTIVICTNVCEYRPGQTNLLFLDERQQRRGELKKSSNIHPTPDTLIPN